jgi:hypothetical protein
MFGHTGAAVRHLGSPVYSCQNFDGGAPLAHVPCSPFAANFSMGSFSHTRFGGVDEFEHARIGTKKPPLI